MRYVFLWIILLLSVSLSGQGSGRTLEFNGSGKAVNLGNEVANGCRSIEMWFKPDRSIASDLSEPLTLIARDFGNGSALSTNEFALFFRPQPWGNGGTLSFVRRLGSTNFEIYSDRNSWEQDHWYHVAITIDANTGIHMYINGVLQSQQLPSTAPIGIQTGSVSDNVTIGKWGNLNIRYFEGNIDEVRLWEISLSEVEIRERMTSKLTGNESGLRAYYRFDENSATTLQDSSPNGWNSNLIGFSENDRVLSGAPLGDVSIYKYVNNWNGESLLFQAADGQDLTVSNINSIANGVHIYRVNEGPGSSGGLEDPHTAYFGVFLTDISGNYDVAILSTPCLDCQQIDTRNDNSSITWSPLVTNSGNCLHQATGESMTGNSYRAEYILDFIGFDLDLGNDRQLCPGESTILDATTPNATYLWQDGSTAPTLTTDEPGVYWVDVSQGNCISRDSVEVIRQTVPDLNLPTELTICPGESAFLDATTPNATYLWQDGSIAPTLTTDEPGVYWVDVSQGNCISRDSVDVRIQIVLDLNLPTELTICPGESAFLDATTPNATYLWQDGSIAPTLTTDEPGVYWVDVSQGNCISRDSVDVRIQIVPDLNLPTELTICPGESAFLDATTPNATYLWQDGSTAPTLTTDEPGVYWVDVSQGNCISRDSVEVIRQTVPDLNLPTELTICPGESAFLDATTTGATYRWGDGNSDAIFEVTSPGTFQVEITVQNCTFYQSTTVTMGQDCGYELIMPNTFTPNNDGTNDLLTPISVKNINSMTTLIFNRWGERVHTSNSVTIDWDGTFENGEPVPGSIYYWSILFHDPQGMQHTRKGTVRVLR